MKFNERDKALLREMHIALPSDCQQCAGSRTMQDFYAIQHNRMEGNISEHVCAIARLMRELHYARLAAFAGWFMAVIFGAIPVIERWTK